MKRKVSLPTMRRAATVKPGSIDKKNRTVDVVFTKGASVLRRGFWETFYEELGLEEGQVRMERLESGAAPVLDNHGMTDKSGVRSTIGVVETASIVDGADGREGIATLRFSKRAEVEEIFQDIEDGILRNISVGYNTYSFEKVGEQNEIPIYRAIDWEAVEISVVPAGADMHAQIRSNDTAMTECTFSEAETEPEAETEVRAATPVDDKDLPQDRDENLKVEISTEMRETQPIKGENTMDPKELKKQLDAARAEGLKEGRSEGSKEGMAAENQRHIEIRSIVKKVGLGEDIAEQMITDNKTIDETRSFVIDELAKKDEAPEVQTRNANPNVSVGEDNARTGRIEGMSSALLHRFRPKNIETRNEGGQIMLLPGHELAEAGREFAYFSLIDMARHCLEANGVRTGMMPGHAIADAALNNVRSLHSTSDFPEILANVLNKTLRGGYDAAPQTFMPFTSEVFVSDFKQISRTNLGDAPNLLKLEEGSEVKRGSMSEAAEKYQVEEYSRIVAISRKVIVNDDLAAFTRIPERMGRRAKDLESDLVWDVFKLNAAMADTFALFSAQHSNLSTVPAAPSETGLTEGRAAMRRQTGLDGAKISLTPAWLFVPPAHETAAEKLVAASRPNNASDVNPFGPNGRTSLRMDVEPRLEDGTGGSLTSWFMTADKGQIDMVELARLEGTNGPQIQSRDGFDVNGVEIKILHDVAAKSIDHRGLFKNAGA